MNDISFYDILSYCNRDMSFKSQSKECIHIIIKPMIITCLHTKVVQVSSTTFEFQIDTTTAFIIIVI